MIQALPRISLASKAPTAVGSSGSSGGNSGAVQADDSSAGHFQSQLAKASNSLGAAQRAASNQNNNAIRSGAGGKGGRAGGKDSTNASGSKSTRNTDDIHQSKSQNKPKSQSHDHDKDSSDHSADDSKSDGQQQSNTPDQQNNDGNNAPDSAVAQAVIQAITTNPGSQGNNAPTTPGNSTAGTTGAAGVSATSQASDDSSDSDASNASSDATTANNSATIPLPATDGTDVNDPTPTPAFAPSSKDTSTTKTTADNTTNPLHTLTQAGAEPASSARPNAQSPVAQQPPPPAQTAATEQDPNVARVARGLQNALQQNGGSVTLRLQPPDLGSVKIQMQIHDGTASVEFQADRPAVSDLLGHQLSSLRDALQTHGLTVDRMEVRTAAPTFSGGTGQHSDGSPSDGRSQGEFFTRQQQGGNTPQQNALTPDGETFDEVMVNTTA